MAGILRLIVPAASAPDCPGFAEIAGGRFDLPLERLRTVMAARRDSIAEHRGETPRTKWHAQKRRHEEILFKKIVDAIEQVDGALERGEDLEQAFTITNSRLMTGPAFDGFGGMLILNGDFLIVECGRCRRSFVPTECRVSDWSVVAAPRMGFGGKCLACPLGHTLFYRETWVS